MKIKFLLLFSVLIVSLMPSKLYGQTLQQDSLALVDFYNTTGGSTWTNTLANNKKWLVGPVANWFGVTVNGGRVTQIHLHVNGVKGNASPSFANLTALTSLTLSGNDLYSIDISTMSKLTYVSLFWNYNLATFKVNSTDKYYPDLTILNLQYNGLTIADIRGMPALITCNLNGTNSATITNFLTNNKPTYYYQLTDLILVSNKITILDISGMPALKYLAANYNKITQIISSDSSNYYRQLATLYLFGNSLSSLNISNMPALETCTAHNPYNNNTLTQFISNPAPNYYPKLKGLYLYQNSNLSGTLNISNMPALEYLSAYGCSLTQLITNPNTGNPELKEINLSNNKLNGTIDLSKMPKLASFQAYNNLLTGMTFNGATEYYPGLTLLHIGNNQISSLELRGMKNLTNLYCYSNNLSSLDLSQQISLGAFWAYSNQLTQIVFHPNADVIDIIVQNNKLTSMDISGMHSLTRLQAYNNLLSNLTAKGSPTFYPNLTYLHLANNQLTSLDVKGMPGLTTLACNLNKLASLDLTQQKNLKDFYAYSNELSSITFHPQVIMETAQLYNNKLTSLDISGMSALSSFQAYNNLLTNITLNPNPGFYSNLTYLHLTGNGLTSVDLRGMPKLTTLGLTGNKLSSIDLTAQTALTSLYIYNNNLSFEDLEPLNSSTFTTYQYSPQANVEMFYNASTQILSVKVGGVNNKYQWKKNGINISGATSSGLTLNQADITANAQYQCVITNTQVTGLTLNSVIKRPLDQFTDIKTVAFRSRSSGNWSNYQSWQRAEGTGFIDAYPGEVPTEGNPVYIEANHSILLTANASCKDLHLSAATDVVRLDTKENVLEVWGKLRIYSGVSPGTSNGIGAGIPGWIKTGTNGRIRLKGTTNRVITEQDEFSNHANLGGWTLECDLANGIIGTINSNFRTGNIIITSGDLDIKSQDFIITQ